MIIFQILVVRNSDESQKLNDTYQMLLLLLFLIVLGFLIFVTPLTLFHTYLAGINLTSWEFLSWMRITYLKVWPKKYGSPFSRGLAKNLKLFCCFNFRRSKQCFQWQMPSKLPKLIT